MLTFTDYFNRRNVLLEMPRVPGANRFTLDSIDSEYLEQFLKQLPEDAPDGLKQAVLRAAFVKRYNKDNILNPDPEVRDVPINTGYEGHTVTKTFKDINMHLKYLANKFEQLGYDVTKLKNSHNDLRQLGDRLAKQWMAWKNNDFGGDGPEVSQYYALKPEFQNAAPETKKRGVLSAGQIDIGNQSKGAGSVVNHSSEIASKGTEKASRSLKEPIPLDDDDKAFIQYFVNKSGVPVPKDGGGRFPKGLVPAFYWRYSSEPFRDPQAEKPAKGLERFPPGTYMNLRFADKEFPAVPVNLPRLKARLADLKAKGVDFIANPLNRVSAMRWLSRGTYMPAAKTRLERDKTFTGIQKYVDLQDLHLKDPENNPSPNIPSKGSRGRDDVSWYDILQQDAENAAKIAIRSMKDKSNQGSGALDAEDFAADALVYLTSDEVVSKAEYTSQAWRVDQAVKYVRQKAGQKLLDQKKDAGDTDMTALSGSRATDKELSDKEAERVKDLEGLKFPTPEEVKDDPIVKSQGWVMTVKSNLLNQRHLGDNFSSTQLDDMAQTVAKMMKRFVDMNDEVPSGEAIKKMIDDVVDSKNKTSVNVDGDKDKDEDDSKKPPAAAMDNMAAARSAEKGIESDDDDGLFGGYDNKKLANLKPMKIKDDDVPPEVTAQIDGDAKISGGKHKSPRELLAAMAAAKKAAAVPPPAKVAPPPPIPIVPPPAPPKKKKNTKKPKPSGPGLFDDYT